METMEVIAGKMNNQTREHRKNLQKGGCVKRWKRRQMWSGSGGGTLFEVDKRACLH